MTSYYSLSAPNSSCHPLPCYATSISSLFPLFFILSSSPSCSLELSPHLYCLQLPVHQTLQVLVPLPYTFLFVLLSTAAYSHFCLTLLKQYENGFICQTSIVYFCPPSVSPTLLSSHNTDFKSLTSCLTKKLLESCFKKKMC